MSSMNIISLVQHNHVYIEFDHMGKINVFYK